MSLMTKARKAESAPTTAADIAQRIETLKAEILILDKEQYRLAALSVDDPKIEAEYQRNIADSVEKQREVDRLQAALIGIDHQQKSQAAAGRVSARRERLGQFVAAARERQAALEEIAAGIETSTIAYSKFVAACGQMERLLPAGAVLQINPQTCEVVADGPPLACGLAIAVAAEMFRAGNGVRLALPGAKAPTLQVVDLPSKIERLAVSAVRQTEAIVADVRGQVERADAAEKDRVAA